VEFEVAVAVELRLLDRDDTGHHVDVVALETDRLPKAPRNGEQSKQRLVSRRQ